MHIRKDGKYTEKLERLIQTVKKCMRCMVHATLYMRIPKLMINRLYQGEVIWIYEFPLQEWHHRKPHYRRHRRRITVNLLQEYESVIRSVHIVISGHYRHPKE